MRKEKGEKAPWISAETTCFAYARDLLHYRVAPARNTIRTSSRCQLSLNSSLSICAHTPPALLLLRPAEHKRNNEKQKDRSRKPRNTTNPSSRFRQLRQQPSSLLDATRWRHRCRGGICSSVEIGKFGGELREESLFSVDGRREAVGVATCLRRRKRQRSEKERNRESERRRNREREKENG